MTDFREAACRLVEAVTEVRRDENTDEFMEHLARAMNAICELVGEGDAVAYDRNVGIFSAVSGVDYKAEMSEE